ncbi:MAG: Clp protease N-terminal domain-containing protein, partial [Chloroflexota bacterium]
RRDRTGSEDLLLGLLAAGGPEAEWLQAQGAGLTEARGAVEFMRTTALSATPLLAGAELLPGAEQALRLAADEARRADSERVAAVHLLLALLRQRGDAAAALSWLGLDPQALLAEVREMGE